MPWEKRSGQDRRTSDAESDREDVAGYFREEFLVDRGNGKFLLDLWAANKAVLIEAGVRAEHIEISNLCTACNPDLLFSHRASRGRRGNLGAFLMIRQTDSP